MKPLWAVAGVALLGAAGAGTLTAAYVVLPREEEVGTSDSQAQAVDSADFLVTTTADAVDAAPGDGVCATAEGECSLRAAVQEANALAGAQSVELPAGTYTLTIPGAGEDAAAAGDLDVADDLTMEGADATSTAIGGNRADRILDVLSEGSLSISGLTVSEGTVQSNVNWPPPNLLDVCGGAIRNSGSLEMTNFIVADSHAYFGIGGGICNGGSLALADGRVNQNSSIPDGGGIWNVGNASLVGVTITGNGAEFNGGGIHSEGGTLKIADSTISENQTTYVGGGTSIRAGTAEFTRVRVTANTTAFQGGGIFNSGDMEVAESMISGNRLDNTQSGFQMGGGGIFNTGLLSIVSSTIDANTGGGVSNDQLSGFETAPTLEMSDTTISGNSAFVGGGVLSGAGMITGKNLTIANNNAQSGGGGVYSVNPPGITLANTVVANNTGGNCSGTATSLGHNLDSDGTCGLSSAGDVSNVAPLLGPLADNGGPTQTHALLEGSPAIDAGSPAPPGSEGACEAADQRGLARPQGGRCDIGAFEVEVAEPAVTATHAPLTPYAVIRNPAPEWTIYSSEKWGYRISYPPGWYNLPNFGAPDEQKYFANQPVRAPLEMNEAGVWMTIYVSSLAGDECLGSSLYSGQIESSTDLVVADRLVQRHLVRDISVEGGPRVVLNLEANGACYTFYTIAFSDETRSAVLLIIDQMMESFVPP